MAKLIYFMPASLDGYIADETGKPRLGGPGEEVFTFIWISWTSAVLLMEWFIFAITRGLD